MTRDHALGAIIGCAVGDALGTTLEFRTNPSADQSQWHTEITGGGPFGLVAGGWTDDTSMMLALMDTYLECGQLDTVACAHKFVDWHRNGRYSHTGTCFDIGFTTLNALTRFEATGDPIAGDTSPSSSGNGGIMRLAPAVVANHQCKSSAVRDAVRQSRITHGSPECLEIAEKMALVLFDGSLESVREDVRAVEGLDWADLNSGGYVRETWECALWCVANTSSFEDALVHAVNRCNDADTAGAVTGQIAGAIYGASAIPVRWLEHLQWAEEISRQAIALYELGTRDL